MMVGGVNKPLFDITNMKAEFEWLVTERWFRLLEISIILGTLYYFSEKIGSLFLTMVYWLSWGIFFVWLRTMGREAMRIFFPQVTEKWFWGRFLIEMVLVVGLYSLITITGQMVIKYQMEEADQRSGVEIPAENPNTENEVPLSPIGKG